MTLEQKGLQASQRKLLRIFRKIRSRMRGETGSSANREMTFAQYKNNARELEKRVLSGEITESPNRIISLLVDIFRLSWVANAFRQRV